MGFGYVVAAIHTVFWTVRLDSGLLWIPVSPLLKCDALNFYLIGWGRNILCSVRVINCNLPYTGSRTLKCLVHFFSQWLQVSEMNFCLSKASLVLHIPCAAALLSSPNTFSPPPSPLACEGQLCPCSSRLSFCILFYFLTEAQFCT